MPELYLDIYDRKKKYEENVCEFEGVNLFLPKWEFQLPIFEFNIGFDDLFNFLIDLHLVLDFHLEIPQIEFPFVEGYKFEKAKAGISRYNQAIVDPPEVSSDILRKFVWDTRYKATRKDVAEWKLSSLTLKKELSLLKELLVSKDIRKEYIEGIINSIALIEGKVLNSSYVGFSVVGVSKVREKPIDQPTFEVRSTVDWKTKYPIETVSVYESHVGLSKVGYSRVTVRKEIAYKRGNRIFSKTLADTLKSIVDFHRKAIGHTEVQTEAGKTKVFTPRVSYYKSMAKKRFRGGNHQVRIQSVINRVRQYLHRKGVIHFEKVMYLNFAHELIYLKHESNRKRKNWKKILTESDLIEKYKNRGADMNILNEIAELIGGMKA